MKQKEMTAIYGGAPADAVAIHDGTSANAAAQAGKVLEFRDVHIGYGEQDVLKGFTADIQKGEFVGLIGANGSGKSTLLKAVSGLLPVRQGEILINGTAHETFSQKERAKQVAVVPQSYAIDYAFTVEDMVMMGRNPYLSFRDREGTKDLELVAEAMRLTRTEQFRDRMFNELSGGEMQRVIIARAIAQQSDIILLDEPTSALDVQHQIEVMELIVKLNRERGKTVLAVLHDLNMAARYCDRLIMLHDGKVLADGAPEEVMTQENLQILYEMQMIIRKNNVFGRPEIVPIRVLDQQREEKGRRIHVICGGGGAAQLLEDLVNRGHLVSVGAINRGTDDWIMANYLGLPMVETEPFTVITPEDQARNLKLMKEADVLVIADVPFGAANIENLRGIEDFAGEFRVHRNWQANDYTPDGEARRIIGDLQEKYKDRFSIFE